MHLHGDPFVVPLLEHPRPTGVIPPAGLFIFSFSLLPGEQRIAHPADDFGPGRELAADAFPGGGVLCFCQSKTSPL
jgi:hypothetical protein